MKPAVPTAPSAEPPSIRLAAFGKHPGWDDHIDDIGLDTDALVAFKRLLYFEGVAANIDAGRWEALAESQRLPGFGHAFIQVAGGQLIVGRMWASRDGKGRARYPMIACAHCLNTGIPWALETVLPQLADVEAACKAATTAPAVVECLAATAQSCTAALGQAGDRHSLPAGLDSHRALAEQAARISPEENATGFKRWLYKMERDLAVYLPTPGRGRREKTERLPQHVRLPVVGDTVERSIFLALALTLRVVEPQTRLLVVRPVGQPWIDVLVGEPRAQQFFCLLATPETLPVVTGIPYTLEPAFNEHGGKVLADWQADPSPPTEFLAAPFAVVAEPAAGATGWWRRVKASLG